MIMTIQSIPFFDGERVYGHSVEPWFTVDPTGSGVYVWERKGVIMYVGKTNNLHRRLLSHHVLNYHVIRSLLQGRGQLLFYKCFDPLMSTLECFLINCFHPPRNTVFPSDELIKQSPHLDECYEAFQDLKRYLP